MRLRYGEIFADAAAMWRSESAVLVPVAAVFFFLPVFALLLFLPIADTRGLAEEAAQAAEIAQGVRVRVVKSMLSQVLGKNAKPAND